jgi:hypothetical protein
MKTDPLTGASASGRRRSPPRYGRCCALQKILSVPYYGLSYNVPLTPALLRLDPMFDPLRNDPRFEKLCKDKQP